MSQGAPAIPRNQSIDAYRGLVMFLMMAEVLDFCRVASARPQSSIWKFLCHQQTHAEWIGCSVHDLIQPSFSFLVGVAVPFSIAARLAKGQSRGILSAHAAWRSLLLILLGVFLRSTNHGQTYWTFEDTLSQIGLGYLLLFVLGFYSVRTQWIAFIVLLAGYWALFACYPAGNSPPNIEQTGVSADWPHWLRGFSAHWNKNSNPAWAFDRWFLNLFPREKIFKYNAGGYSTLSFIPTLATMILGLLAGGVLRSNRRERQKLAWLCLAGISCLLAGAIPHFAGLCPIVKRIWTPSWALYSGGWCLLLLASFYSFIELGGRRRWAFPLMVIGMNSIAAYCGDHLFAGFIHKSLITHFGKGSFEMLGTAYAPLLQGAAVLLMAWLILYWMYRRKIFLRV